MRDQTISNKTHHTIEDMLKQLRSEGLKGDIYKTQPGMKKEFGLSINDADFVICVFERRDQFTSDYVVQVIQGYKVKFNQDGCFIPVFCDLTEEQSKEMLNKPSEQSKKMLNKPSLIFLNVIESAYTVDDGWLESIIQQLTTNQSLGMYGTYIFCIELIR